MKNNRLISLLLRIIGAGGSALFAFIVAKLTNPEFLGDFQYFLTITIGLAVLARAGLDRGVVRYIAKSEKNIEKKQIMQFSLSVILKKTIIIMIPMILILLAIAFEKTLTSYNFLLLFSFPVIAVAVLISGYYKGAFNPNLSFIFEMGFISLLSSILILFAVLLNKNYYLIIPLSFVIASVLLVACGLWVNRKNFFYKDNSNKYVFTALKKSSNNFMWMTITIYIQQLALVLALTHYLSSYDLGLYKIAEKLAMLVGFFQAVVTAVYSPYFSRLFHKGDLVGLAKYARKASNMSLLFSLPSLIILALFSSEILKLFGGEYAQAKNILITLAIAQFINVVLGPASMVLNQTTYEKLSKNIIVIFSLISIPLIVVSCYFYGALGGAGAILIVSLLQNTLFYIYVYKKLNILIYPWFILRNK